MVCRTQKRLWIFDFDGTISPIVADPYAATLHPVCRSVLQGLASRAQETVAVLSSRSLGDLVLRVSIPGLFLGGSSGIAWQLPGGAMKQFEPDGNTRLKNVRTSVLPLIKPLAKLPGIRVEDKHWSIALHTRNAPAESKKRLGKLLKNLQGRMPVGFYHGPEVIEVQLLPEINKAFGVRKLGDLLGFEPAQGNLVYAGDDENDAAAMQWVQACGGTVFVVGDGPAVPGATTVGSPFELAMEILQLA